MFTRAVNWIPILPGIGWNSAECDCRLYMLCGKSVSFDDILSTAFRALDLEPGLASAHTSLGTALLATGRIDEAEQSYQKATAAEPDFATAHYFYGRACLILDRKQDAARLLQRAADLASYDVGT